MRVFDGGVPRNNSAMLIVQRIFGSHWFHRAHKFFRLYLAARAILSTGDASFCNEAFNSTSKFCTPFCLLDSTADSAACRSYPKFISAEITSSTGPAGEGAREG